MSLFTPARWIALMLCLLLKSSGNTEKRRQLIEIIGRQRTAELLQILKGLE